jgi:hypothetical protein
MKWWFSISNDWLSLGDSATSKCTLIAMFGSWDRCNWHEWVESRNAAKCHTVHRISGQIINCARTEKPWYRGWLSFSHYTPDSVMCTHDTHTQKHTHTHFQKPSIRFLAKTTVSICSSLYLPLQASSTMLCLSIPTPATFLSTVLLHTSGHLHILFPLSGKLFI